MDGELDPEQAVALIAALCADDELRAEWIAFHLAGDALRSTEVASAHSKSFCMSVAAAIAREPAIVAPRAWARQGAPLRRYILPGLAVAASAAVIGFVAVPLLRNADTQAPVQATAVQAPPAAVATAEHPDEARRTACRDHGRERACAAGLSGRASRTDDRRGLSARDPVPAYGHRPVRKSLMQPACPVSPAAATIHRWLATAAARGQCGHLSFHCRAGTRPRRPPRRQSARRCSGSRRSSGPRCASTTAGRSSIRPVARCAPRASPTCSTVPARTNGYRRSTASRVNTSACAPRAMTRFAA